MTRERCIDGPWQDRLHGDRGIEPRDFTCERDECFLHKGVDEGVLLVIEGMGKRHP